jgi:hypothetical protein
MMPMPMWLPLVIGIFLILAAGLARRINQRWELFVDVLTVILAVVVFVWMLI